MLSNDAIMLRKYYEGTTNIINLSAKISKNSK